MIRKALPADFDFFYQLYMHPDVNPFLLYEMMDAPSFKPIYSELLQREVLYVYHNGDVAAGMFKLVPQSYRSAHIAYLGGLAVHPEFSGKGVGTKMLQEIIAFAKEKGFLRIELSVATFNEKAIRLYEKNGFEKEGVLRKLTHLVSEGRFIDEILMSYLVE
jgi:RimJ/RimL family protein N-acetyltransferase